MILGYKKRSKASRLRDVILLYTAHETAPGVLHPSLGSPAEERHGPVLVGPEEGHENG